MRFGCISLIDSLFFYKDGVKVIFVHQCVLEKDHFYCYYYVPHYILHKAIPVVTQSMHDFY